MATLTIKNIDPELHDCLKREAARTQRSLNSLIVALLEEAAQDRERRARMRAHGDELERFVRKLPASSNAVDLLREDRESK